MDKKSMNIIRTEYTRTLQAFLDVSQAYSKNPNPFLKELRHYIHIELTTLENLCCLLDLPVWEDEPSDSEPQPESEHPLADLFWNYSLEVDFRADE